MVSEPEKKRVLLLMTPATYRGGAFLSAAQRLNLEVVVGIDMPETLTEYWHVPLGVDFNKVEVSLRTVVEYAKEHPFVAILSVDDSASELAALASAALGLAHNTPGAAEAARDKLLMRTLMSQGGAPCPMFRPFLLSDDPTWVASQVSYPCVLKPLRLSGSRGVIRANNPEECITAFERLRRLLFAEAGMLQSNGTGDHKGAGYPQEVPLPWTKDEELAEETGDNGMKASTLRGTSPDVDASREETGDHKGAGYPQVRLDQEARDEESGEGTGDHKGPHPSEPHPRPYGMKDADMSILAEDFIPGFEVALEGILTHGQLKVLTLFDKPDPLDGPFFEETIYVTPSRLPDDVQESIAFCVSIAAASLELREGPVHAELRVNEQGPWMLEIAGRSIGGLCSTVLEFGAGMCLEELILRHAIGEEIASIEREGKAAGVMMIPIPVAGMLKSVHGVEEAQAVPLITGVEITAKLNHQLVPLPEGASYLGFIFARGDTPSRVEEALRQAHMLLRFDIRREIPVLRVM